MKYVSRFRLVASNHRMQRHPNRGQQLLQSLKDLDGVASVELVGWVYEVRLKPSYNAAIVAPLIRKCCQESQLSVFVSELPD